MLREPYLEIRMLELIFESKDTSFEFGGKMPSKVSLYLVKGGSVGRVWNQAKLGELGGSVGGGVKLEVVRLRENGMGLGQFD